MGPTCEVLLDDAPDETVLRFVDRLLAESAERIERTRKGRVWDVWVAGRPIHVVCSNSLPGIELSAGCNAVEDYALLRWLGAALADGLNGVASEPTK